MAWFPRRPSKRTVFRAWLYSGIVYSFTVMPVWSQEGDIPDPTIDDFNPLPAAIGSEDEAPAPFADPEVRETEMEADAPVTLTTEQAGFLKQTPVQRQRAFLDAANNSEETLKLGRDSFERGLMPLEDYADLTQADLEIRLSVAGLQNDR
ncbi:MAG: hypothetical protein JWN70_4837, partial [Planctomycetaceae bacterium]|nr:hypothetical protein [Planctomycetaceae bacterium]